MQSLLITLALGIGAPASTPAPPPQVAETQPDTVQPQTDTQLLEIARREMRHVLEMLEMLELLENRTRPITMSRFQINDLARSQLVRQMGCLADEFPTPELQLQYISLKYQEWLREYGISGRSNSFHTFISQIRACPLRLPVRFFRHPLPDCPEVSSDRWDIGPCNFTDWERRIKPRPAGRSGS